MYTPTKHLYNARMIYFKDGSYRIFYTAWGSMLAYLIPRGEWNV